MIQTIIHLENSGEKFIMDNQFGINNWIIDGGIPEKSLIQWCKEFLDSESTFIDIGAHMGTYSITLAKHCKNVISFEPQRLIYNNLCGGIALNNLENVYTYNCALGDYSQNGKSVKLYSDSLDDGTSSLYDYGMKEIFSFEIVTVKSLDSYLPMKHVQKVGLIKIDAEGAEKEILKGGFQTLKEYDYPPILFECNKGGVVSCDELFDLLRAWDYKILGITGYGNMYLASR